MPATSASPIKIISDLGIVEPWDIDSDTEYLSALMEAVNTLSVSNSSDNRIPILQDEVKRLRAVRKKADPNFKIAKKKISAEAFKKGTAVGGAQKVAADTKGASSIVPYKTPTDIPSIEQGGMSSPLLPVVERIANTVDSIYGTLVGENKQDKAQAEKDARKDEDKKRTLRETLLESKGFKTLAKGVGKVLQPVQSMFSKVIQFISTIIMGRIVMKIIDWWGNPENKGKIVAMTRFVGDWWPVLMAGFLLFGTGLGGLVATIVGIVTPLIGPMLLAVSKLMMNPWVAAAVGLGLAAWGISGLISNKSETPQEVSGDRDLDTTTVTEFSGGGLEEIPPEPPQEFATGGLVEPREYSRGGRVTGPSGRDNVPARLTAGEFVMSKGAVNKWGTSLLNSMNLMGGGTNRPTMGGYEGGGEVKLNVPKNQTEKISDIMPVMGTIFNLPGMEKIITQIKTDGPLKTMSNMIESAESGTIPDIVRSTMLTTPSPPVATDQEVIVTPLAVEPPSQSSTEGSASRVPRFSAVPGSSMQNKVKVLGFVR